MAPGYSWRGPVWAGVPQLHCLSHYTPPDCSSLPDPIPPAKTFGAYDREVAGYAGGLAGDSVSRRAPHGTVLCPPSPRLLGPRLADFNILVLSALSRSEERRVGKECRSR